MARILLEIGMAISTYLEFKVEIGIVVPISISTRPDPIFVEICTRREISPIPAMDEWATRAVQAVMDSNLIRGKNVFAFKIIQRWRLIPLFE